MSAAIALLAGAEGHERLLNWLDQHRVLLEGFPLLAPAELAQTLAEDPYACSLVVSPLAALAAGGDIQLAGRILAGSVGAVLFFVDPATAPEASPDLRLLLRACALAGTPLALNEATATLALRGLGHSRLAYLIFNPVAGQGDPNQDLTLIRSLLEPQLLLNVVMTRPDRDPADQARELVDLIQARPEPHGGSALILASGGDGTVSAVAGAVIHSGIPLGVIPRGTANAFASALAIPADLEGACATILAGHTRVVDAARCNDTPMILLAGIGFEAGMVDRATRELKTMLGPLAYVLAGAQQLASQEPFQARLTIDGQVTELQSGAITVANVAPATSVLAQGFGQVIPDDGLLEITIASPVNRLQGLNAFASLVASAVVRSPTNRPDLLCLRAQAITISTDPPQNLVIDGEMLLAGNPISITCLSGALTVFTPLPVA
ncbi:NAD(+)/NADH kinase [Synechococcus sp. CS-1329]|jgi:diacylglycerol kinase (ATP)|uniref:diacylglycerol kinase family protein n=1 Tax=Synechococcus sp. CS-1329 TaxID=2847975 RepID=UPI00223ADDE8|nr:diacylglycerol kinase family protein [Synechococcus sp. CS-1329]MCT0217646.1 NAD(+)/NADH kinase [Synechococcus sp. CS-1329]